VVWMRQQLLGGHFIDREDIDIFRIVNSPAEAVRVVRAGIKKHWWRPLDQETRAIANHADAECTPLEGSKSGNTGEGTRYGRRPERPMKDHAKASRKPQQ